MSGGREPTDDDAETVVFELRNVRPKRSTERGIASGTAARTTLPSSPRSKSPTERRRQAIARRAVERSVPREVSPLRDRSEPIRVISMKTPAELAGDKQATLAVKQHMVKLRAQSPTATPAQPTGNLAPRRGRGSKQVRARKLRDYVMWGSTVILLGGVVTLAIWLIARR